MTYYLAGPMTGYVNFNFDAFDAATKVLRSQGYHVINPAENFGGKQDLEYEEYLRVAHQQVRQDAEEGIILLDGWQQSTGALREVGWALELGRNIISFEWMTGLPSPMNDIDEQCISPGHPDLTGNEERTVTFNLGGKDITDEVEERLGDIDVTPISQQQPSIARRLDSLANPMFMALLDYVGDVHKRKAAGYSGLGSQDTWKNFREAENWGLTPSQGCTMRIGDKYRRTQNLLKDPSNDQVGESLFDTLTDLANYVLILVCLLYEEGKITLPAELEHEG